jgi:hypothetical protein
MLIHASPDSQHSKLDSVYITTLYCKHLADFPSTLQIFGQRLEAICVMRKSPSYKEPKVTQKKLEYMTNTVRTTMFTVCGATVPEKWSGRDYNFS